MPGEVNCIFTKALIPFVEQEVGAAGVDAIVRIAGRSREYLTADHNWIPLGLADELVRLGMDLMHEPDEARWARRYGEAFMDWKPSRGERSYIGTYTMGIGDPRGVYERFPVVYQAQVRHAQLDVEALGRRHARFRLTPLPGQRMPRWACVWMQVMLERFPTNWGLPRAVVVESRCAAQGADACVLDVDWRNPSLGVWFWRTTAAGALASCGLAALLAAGASFPAAAWIAAGLPAVAGVTAGLALRERERRRHVRRLLDLQSEEIIFSNNELEQKFRDLEDFARGLEDKVRIRTEELERSNRGLTQALARQTATADILRIISRSPIDAQPVFEAILDNAARLCESDTGILFRFDGEAFHALARRVPDPAFDALFDAPRRPGPAAGLGRVASEKRAVHIEDVRAGAGYLTGDTIARQTVELGGARTWLGVPLLKDGEVTGAIVIYRKDVRPFADAQVELLETFADQAVIAVENVRLFTELQEKNRAISEALEQQTATSDILRAISSSPTDVGPVFETIVASAARLCEAPSASVYRLDGETISLAAVAGGSAGQGAALRTVFPRRADDTHIIGRVLSGRRMIHVEDIGVDRRMPELQRILGYRTLLAVPMLREGTPIGAIGIWRTEPRPFSPAQIELLKTFADQAVIAIENVRLFTELQEKNRAISEALEQQTATSEILRVISRSPTDVEPVFEAIVRNAIRRCDAVEGVVFRLDGGMIHVGFAMGPREAVEYVRQFYPKPLSTTSGMVGRIVLTEGRLLHVEDIEVDPRATPVNREIARRLGSPALLAVPLVREGHVLGAIAVSRRETGRFTDEQIELLETFADQAVIAIENVRLFTELQKKNGVITQALERQTATAEILRVISRTQTDPKPVFDIISQSVRRLCSSDGCGIFLVEDGQLVPQNTPPGAPQEVHARRHYPRPVDTTSFVGRAILEQRVIHVPDLDDPSVPKLPTRTASTRRCQLTVPLLRDGKAIGALTAVRDEPVPFSDAQIELLQTFADQAVIAIENVRLITELQAAYRDLQAAQVQLVQREKMASVGQLVAGVAHELNNPIGFVSSNVVTLEDFIARIRALLETYDAVALPDAERARVSERRAELKVDYALRYLDSMVQGIREGADRARKIVRDLRIFARTEDDVWQPVDLHEDIESSLTLLNHVMKEQVAVHRKFGRVAQVECVRSQIDQVFLNLLANAAQAINGPGEITIETKEDSGFAVVRITDSGPGIPADVMGRIFDPFFTTKAVGEGTGLGLSISYEIIKKHRGEITAESPAGGGATFTVRIPIARRM